MAHERTKGKWGEDPRVCGNIISDTGRLIANTNGYSDNFSDGKCYEENKANAKFIILACNAHDQLVEAVRRLLDHAGEQEPTCFGVEMDSDALEAAKEFAKNTLKQIGVKWPTN